mmetsp:Transcript_30199/g.50001  ORF Transcript_30199/g.50001 Transcript_30199/m.50001 type:complete len:143 (-) Transcript_30199:519-947(-)
MSWLPMLLTSCFIPLPRLSIDASLTSVAAPALGAPFPTSRRDVLAAAVAFASSPLRRAMAADTSSEAPRWISGKSDPIRKTSKDKPSGTKKDPKYLTCLNDCVPRVQGPPTSGNQKDRLDCLEECQQECCFTYQQCTYKVRQ